MRSRITVVLFWFVSAVAFPCELCKKNQPKGFENITHGEGPGNGLDFIIMYGAILIVGYTLIMSIYYLARPREREKGHIKNIILDEHNSFQ